MNKKNNSFRSLRYKAKLENPDKAAEKLKISKSMLYKIERGERKPGRDLIQQMSIVYNCTLEEIFLALNDTESVNKDVDKKNYTKGHNQVLK